MNFEKTIFLTGFPGFIAERLVERLADADTQFFLLVQKDFFEKAFESVERIAAKTNAPLENFALIEGDITKPNLGISNDDDLATIRVETTDVFHLAAVYDLAVAKNLAFSVNVDGTNNVNDFVKSLWNLKRYNYVSTCYVAGKRTGKILESELEHDAGFRNFYEETKYLAEVSVERMKSDFPVCIFRPSVVVGDSQTGETAKYDGIYYLIKYVQKSPKLLRLVNVGNKNVRLNLVPVDFVVESIAALSMDDAAIGKTFALADPNPLATTEIFDLIAEKLSGKKSVVTPPSVVTEKSLYLPFSPPLSGLPHSSVPYFFLSQTYDTSFADEFLKKYSVACPNFATYVGKMVEFVEKNPEL